MLQQNRELNSCKIDDTQLETTLISYLQTIPRNGNTIDLIPSSSIELPLMSSSSKLGTC